MTLTEPRCEELYLLLCAVSTQQRLVHLSGYRLALWRCGFEALLPIGFDTEQEEWFAIALILPFSPSPSA